jgi:hypothetical protein
MKKSLGKTKNHNYNKALMITQPKNEIPKEAGGLGRT